MTCRCATKEEHAQRAVDQQAQREASQRERGQMEARIRELDARTPNPDRFAIDDIEQVGKHLVIKVEYQGCAGCSYDRRKVMVFLNATIKDEIRWRRIDPHFREPPPYSTKLPAVIEAPGPAARFPATSVEWADAIAYARGKAP